MYRYWFAFFALLTAASVSPAAADSLIQCTEKKKAGSSLLQWMYGVKATASQRLATDIVFANANGNVTIVPTSRVAQFKHSDAEAFILIDDNAENTTHVLDLKSQRVKKNEPFIARYKGTLEMIADDKIVRVECTVTVQ